MALVSLLSVLVLVVAAVQLARGGPARAAPLSDCTPSSGTAVAVDFAHWGGPGVLGCGVNEPTGLDLLHEAGFTTSGDAQDGPAFVCRIGNDVFKGGAQYPTASADPCTHTPPGDAYWSYWLANSGSNSWSFSPKGAASEPTASGQVQAWAFGAGDPPTFSPASVRPAAGGGWPTTVVVVGGSPTTSARTSAPGPVATATRPAGSAATPGGAAAAGATTGHGSHPAHSTSARTTSTATTRKTGTSTSSASATATDGDGSASPSIVAARSSGTGHSGSGSAVGIVVLLVLVLALAGTGFWLRYRRAHPAE